ncbi:hypothetical protein FGO68_gene13327 [Halteria grandinella]|uniref:Thioredoxin domain-containing protein n=1 Tax=Halteria grandinella TaxID=5974 RepID=A0A8J8NN70_HALGN|nr:hypothetical protein FGO68_gene13327 [Halteria grandinella]
MKSKLILLLALLLSFSLQDYVDTEEIEQIRQELDTDQFLTEEVEEDQQVEGEGEFIVYASKWYEDLKGLSLQSNDDLISLCNSASNRHYVLHFYDPESQDSIRFSSSFNQIVDYFQTNFDIEAENGLEFYSGDIYTMPDAVSNFHVFDVPTLVFITVRSTCRDYFLFEGPYIDSDTPIRWILQKASGLIRKEIPIPEPEIISPPPPPAYQVINFDSVKQQVNNEPIPENYQEPAAHPSQNQLWYPDEGEDTMKSRIEKGYDFEYPKDSFVDGYTISRFNEAMMIFNQRQNLLQQLISHNLSMSIKNLTFDEPIIQLKSETPITLYLIGGFVFGFIVTSLLLIRTIKYFTIFYKQQNLTLATPPQIVHPANLQSEEEEEEVEIYYDEENGGDISDEEKVA